MEPPKHAPAKPKPVVKGFGPLGILSGITGLRSGRTRTDNFDNFVADMLGLPSTEDYERESEQRFRKWYPNWKPGDQIEI